MGYAKVWYGVTCRIHGIEEYMSSEGKWLKTTPPKGKIDRINKGCPKCAALKKKEAA